MHSRWVRTYACCDTNPFRCRHEDVVDLWYAVELPGPQVHAAWPRGGVTSRQHNILSNPEQHHHTRAQPETSNLAWSCAWLCIPKVTSCAVNDAPTYVPLLTSALAKMLGCYKDQADNRVVKNRVEFSNKMTLEVGRAGSYVCQGRTTGTLVLCCWLHPERCWLDLDCETMQYKVRKIGKRGRARSSGNLNQQGIVSTYAWYCTACWNHGRRRVQCGWVYSPFYGRGLGIDRVEA